MKKILTIMWAMFLITACEKNDNADIKKENEGLSEGFENTFKVQEKVNIEALKNSPEYFDINKDGENDFKLSMSLNTRFMEDCDPIDEFDTVSCAPWDEYLVDITALNRNYIADTLQETFVLVRTEEPVEFDVLNWANGSRSVVIEPFLNVGAQCDSWMCDITEGYVPVKVRDTIGFDYGWLKISIQHQQKISIVEYAYGLTNISKNDIVN